jgi:MFS family permease
MLLASLAGRVGFLMLPLGLILAAGSAARAGALVAAFSIASALAPVRGRVVDRHGPRALAAFALACAAATWALVLAVSADAPAAVVVALGALTGLVVPPLGPFTRAILGRALRDRGERLQHAYGLDTAGEESALIVAPLIVALAASLFSAPAALAIAAAVMLAGTVAASRTTLATTVEVHAAKARAGPLPAALWVLYGALAATAAALGAIEIAVPAAAREQGQMSAAGVVLAAMAAGTVAGSLLAGRRRWKLAPQWRVVALAAPMAAGVALAATVSGRLELLAAALVIPGAVLGALFASLYVLADQLAPAGSATRTFAWLVTANNGGLALGAAAAGALTDHSGADAGLWLGAACALAAVIPGTVAALLSARELHGRPMSEHR